MRNVLLGWASGVTDWEAHAVASGLTDVLSIARQTNVPEVLGESWVIDGCVQKLLGTPVPQGAQQPVEDLYYALVGSLAEDKSEGFDALSAKYIVVAIVDVDLTDSDADWIFGATKTNLVPVSMISVVRPRNMVERKALKALRRLGRHEFGHALGLVPDERTERVVDTDWSIGKHCTNVCAMRQTDVEHGTVTLEAATEEEEVAAVVLCDDCVADLLTLADVRGD